MPKEFKTAFLNILDKFFVPSLSHSLSLSLSTRRRQRFESYFLSSSLSLCLYSSPYVHDFLLCLICLYACLLLFYLYLICRYVCLCVFLLCLIHFVSACSIFFFMSSSCCLLDLILLCIVNVSKAAFSLSLSLSSTYSFALSSCCTSLPMYVISSGTSIIAYLSFCLFDFDLYWIFSLSLSAKSLSS